MHHFFGMADQGEHGIDRFDQHPVVPGPARTHLEVGRIALSGMKPGIAQDHHPVLEHFDQGLEQGIVDLGRRPQPADDAAPLVDQQTEFVAHDPAVVGDPFTTDLPGTAPFPNRMDQFDAVAVDHPQQGRLGQKPQGPPPVRGERPKQPGPLGQARKQGVIVPGEPAVEGSVADPLQGVQDPQRYHLAGPQLRLGVFGVSSHLIVDPTEQVRDKVDCGHDRSPFLVNLGSLYRLTWGQPGPLQPTREKLAPMVNKVILAFFYSSIKITRHTKIFQVCAYPNSVVGSCIFFTNG